jgi:hypothetical protein
MRMLRISTWSALLVLATVLPDGVSAAPCAGFADVDDTSPFCVNVQWMKNRQITLGCAAPVISYCPNDPVTRLSMSAFLNRLGVALTPATIGEIDLAPGAAITLASLPVVCRTLNVFSPIGFPRTARGSAIFVFQTSGAADVAAQLVETIDGGTTWTDVSPVHMVSAADGKYATLAVMLPPRALSVATTYEYGLRVSRVLGSATTGNPNTYFCRYKLVADNRNPSTPPLDE